jgi:hypothetical protein
MMSRSRGSRRMHRGWQHQARGTATNMEQPTWGTRCSRLDADMLGSRANLIETQLGALALSACLPALWEFAGTAAAGELHSMGHKRRDDRALPRGGCAGWQSRKVYRSRSRAC